MTNEEALKRFNDDVEWLKTVVPPEEIYIFANQVLLGAQYFMSRWSDWVDIDKECKLDRETKAWVMNLAGVYKLRALGITEKLNTKWLDP